MRLDKQSMFSDGQTISGTSTESSVLDIAAAGIAEAEAYIVARFDTATHGCSAVELKGSDDNSTFVTYGKMAISDTTAGAGANFRVPQGLPRYLKLVYTGTAMTGKVTAGFTLQAPSPRGKRIGDYAAN